MERRQRLDVEQAQAARGFARCYGIQQRKPGSWFHFLQVSVCRRVESSWGRCLGLANADRRRSSHQRVLFQLELVESQL